jgi:NAD(P)-dependent dehydrogenase (short-subunit alcohol dehydrogenase family)
MTANLAGRVAVVTGGTRGLGREMVRALARAGADVVIASRRYDGCALLAEEVSAETGSRALPVACHVGRWADCDALAEAAYDQFGRVDILVNNAGMAPVYDRVEDITEELWKKVLDVNLTGTFRLCARIGPSMAADGGGSIVNISSVASVRPRPNTVPYAAAKAGVNAITQAFAHAFGPSVRVNGIMPGTFLTDISRHWDMEAFERDAQTMALRRFGQPDEIVGTLLYLVSDASSYTTGALVRVDGGFP